MNSHSELERARLKRIAHEYEAKGYRVLISPSSAELPDFLQSYHPDMIASSDSENVVIDVMSSGTVSGSSYMPYLASAVEGKEDWRYELVLTNPRSAAPYTEPPQLLDPPDISARLKSARVLIQKKDYDAATLLMWTAIEASLRRIASREGTPVSRKDPTYLVKRLYTLGLLSRSDYRVLLDASRTRNTIAHGYKERQATKASLAKLAKVAERLLNDATRQEAKHDQPLPDA